MAWIIDALVIFNFRRIKRLLKGLSDILKDTNIQEYDQIGEGYSSGS